MARKWDIARALPQHENEPFEALNEESPVRLNFKGTGQL
jgi:hypothetical protein